jgi:hypothetical protein
MNAVAMHQTGTVPDPADFDMRDIRCMVRPAPLPQRWIEPPTFVLINDC